MTRKRPSGQGGTEEPRGRQEPRERLITRCEWLLRHANSLENDEWPQGQMSKDARSAPKDQQGIECQEGRLMGARMKLGALKSGFWVCSSTHNGLIIPLGIFCGLQFSKCATFVSARGPDLF